MEFKKLSFVMLVSVIMVALFGCSLPVPASPQENLPGLNLIIAANGKVLLKRDGWTGFHPTSFGAALYRGDQLQAPEDSDVVVLCENLTTWTVPGGSPSGLSNGCPQVSEPALVRRGSLIAHTRGGGTDPLIPYIISPRATKLLDPTPSLRWNAVPGVSTYTLRISGTNWQEQVETTEFEYPGTPALQSGTDYLLVVEAGNGRSSRDEGLPDLGFSLLSDQEASSIREEVSRIDALRLSEEARAFAQAQLYASHQLYAEAIELLEASAGVNDQSANVSRSLGELYQQVGLLTQAELRYLQAVELAKAGGDIESAAEAQDKLGEVYLALGNTNEARTWLSQAQTGYESLGDTQRANQIAAQLAELNK